MNFRSMYPSFFCSLSIAIILICIKDTSKPAYLEFNSLYSPKITTCSSVFSQQYHHLGSQGKNLSRFLLSLHSQGYVITKFQLGCLLQICFLLSILITIFKLTSFYQDNHSHLSSSYLQTYLFKSLHHGQKLRSWAYISCCFNAYRPLWFLE